MCTSDQERSETAVCGLCRQAFSDGETVVQVVEDRHPNYDKEIVLHTYHKSCCANRETVTHDCPHCGSWYHLALLKKGRSGRDLAQHLFCPLCGTPFRSDQQGQSADEWAQNPNEVPTIVIFVSGGLVQGIEGYGAVRAVVCDFDNEEGPDNVGGRPCTVSVWEAPEAPGEEFGQVIDLAGRADEAASPDEES